MLLDSDSNALGRRSKGKHGPAFLVAFPSGGCRAIGTEAEQDPDMSVLKTLKLGKAAPTAMPADAKGRARAEVIQHLEQQKQLLAAHMEEGARRDAAGLQDQRCRRAGTGDAARACAAGLVRGRRRHCARIVLADPWLQFPGKAFAPGRVLGALWPTSRPAWHR